MAESTHKHRNVIDDILDLGLSAACVVYYLFHEQIGLTLTDEQMVTIGAAGAAGRASLRRIMMKLWSAKLGAESNSESDDADADDAEAEGDDDQANKETVSAPVSDGEGSDEKETPASSDETQEAPKVEPPPKVGG